MKNAQRVTPFLRHADNILLVFSALCLLVFAGMETFLLFSRTFVVQPVTHLLITIAVCILFYLSGILYRRRTGSTLRIRKLMILFFGVYVYMILCFTLFDPEMRRTGQGTLNLIPFRSIQIYLNMLLRGTPLSRMVAVLNLLGNFLLFAPTAFFLPLFWKPMQKWYLFFAAVLSMVLVVESLQLLLNVGCFDIDDILLNGLGAVSVFFLLRIPPIKRFCLRFAGEGTGSNQNSHSAIAKNDS